MIPRIVVTQTAFIPVLHQRNPNNPWKNSDTIKILATNITFNTTSTNNKVITMVITAITSVRMRENLSVSLSEASGLKIPLYTSSLVSG